MRYPAVLAPDSNDTVLVSFPDVPGAVSFGDTEQEALANGLEALLTVFDALMADKRDIPAPSTPRKGHSVEIPALDAAKIEMYRTMRAQGVTKYELAKRLDWHGPQVDRVLKIRHGSQIDQVAAAFGALGKRMVISVVDVEYEPKVRVRRSDRPQVHAGVLASAKPASAAVKRAAKKR